MIPLVDLVAQYHSIQSEIDTSIHQVLESGQFILGTQVSSLEKEVAAYLGVKHAIGVASGTDALILALRSLKIGPGDEVILPAYTFYATAGAILSVGATPVFVDVNPNTYCLDTRLVEHHINSKTKAIIPVHLFGYPVEMESLLKQANAYGLKIVEDNAQAFGSEYSGRMTGSFGDLACLSFFPTKNLGGYGDGGMVVTNEDALADYVRTLRTHGWKKKYYPEIQGYNSRLDALQAAILRAKLPHVNVWNEQRRELAHRYTQLLSSLDLVTPCEMPGSKHVYHLYVIRVKNRDKLQGYLKEAGIASEVYYPQPAYLAKPCSMLGYVPGDFPEADLASQETLAIPLYPELGIDRLNLVVTALKKAFKEIL